MGSKIMAIQHKLDAITSYLTPLLPLANCHMVEFLTENHWQRLLPDKLQGYFEHLELNDAVERFWESAGNESLNAPTELSKWITSSREQCVTANNIYCMSAQQLQDRIMAWGGGEQPTIRVTEFMNSKKSYEVSTMSRVVASLYKASSSSCCVEAGGGRGHLLVALSLGYGIPSLTVDCDESKVLAAAARVKIIQKQWHAISKRKTQNEDVISDINNKRNTNKIKPGINAETNNQKPNQHVSNEHQNAYKLNTTVKTNKNNCDTKINVCDITENNCGTCSNFNSTEENCDTNQTNTNLSDTKRKSIETDENNSEITKNSDDTDQNLDETGENANCTNYQRHTNVSDTKINSIETDENKPETTKNSHDTDQNFDETGKNANCTNYQRHPNDCDTNGNECTDSESNNSYKRGDNKCSGAELHRFATAFITKDTDLAKVVKEKFHRSEDIKVLLTGLHTCGDLGPSSLRIFVSQLSTSAVLTVPCCYHLLTEGSDDGFPMSRYLQGYSLGRNARMLSAQSMDRVVAARTRPANSLLYRAMLQVLIKTHLPNEKFTEGKLKRLSKCDSFQEYFRKADAILNLNLFDRLPQGCLNEIYDEEGSQKKLVLFYLLRLCLAQVVESVILLDRVMYLYENGVEKAFIVKLFDPILSPRCHAIVAVR